MLWYGIGSIYLHTVTAYHSRKLVILAFTILASVYGALGGTRHIYFLEDTELQTAIKLFWIANVLLVASLCFGKVSVALLLQRLLPRTAKYKRWFLWFVSTSLTLIFIFVTAVILGQCQPVEALWLAAPGTCWNKDAVNGWNLFAGSKYPAPSLRERLSHDTNRLLYIHGLRAGSLSNSVPVQSSVVSQEEAIAQFATWCRPVVS